jgi:hypothetical protein
MKRNLVALVVILNLLVTTVGLAVTTPHPAEPHNCFRGVVYNRMNQPVPGVTVKLFSPGGGVETYQTTDQGVYRFCRSYGGWTPGTYLIVVGCCEQSRYRSGDGDIYVNFVIPCNCK